MYYVLNDSTCDSFYSSLIMVTTDAQNIIDFLKKVNYLDVSDYNITIIDDGDVIKDEFTIYREKTNYPSDLSQDDIDKFEEFRLSICKQYKQHVDKVTKEQEDKERALYEQLKRKFEGE